MILYSSLTDLNSLTAELPFSFFTHHHMTLKQDGHVLYTHSTYDKWIWKFFSSFFFHLCVDGTFGFISLEQV